MVDLNNKPKAYLIKLVVIAILSAIAALLIYQPDKLANLVVNSDRASLKSVGSQPAHLERVEDRPRSSDIKVTATVK